MMLMAITVYITALVKCFLLINPDWISLEDHFDFHKSRIICLLCQPSRQIDHCVKELGLRD